MNHIESCYQEMGAKRGGHLEERTSVWTWIWRCLNIWAAPEARSMSGEEPVVTQTRKHGLVLGWPITQSSRGKMKMYKGELVSLTLCMSWLLKLPSLTDTDKQMYCLRNMLLMTWNKTEWWFSSQQQGVQPTAPSQQAVQYPLPQTSAPSEAAIAQPVSQPPPPQALPHVSAGKQVSATLLEGAPHDFCFPGGKTAKWNEHYFCALFPFSRSDCSPPGSSVRGVSFVHMNWLI